MKGKIFKIKNMEDELVLPITTTEAVYSEDGKTLNDEIDNINSSLDNIEDEKATRQEVDVERKRIDNINSSLDNNTNLIGGKDLLSKMNWRGIIETLCEHHFNIKDFGAKGDGVTDDTEAIKKAITVSSNLYFPEGVYLVSEKIVLNKSTFFYGSTCIRTWGSPSKTVIQATHDDFIFECEWGNANNFEKLCFKGKGIKQPCCSQIVECEFVGSLGIEKSRVSVIERCSFHNCTEAGIKQLIDSRVSNCFFYNNEKGIYMYDSNDNIIEHNKIEWNNVGIELDTNVYNLIQGNIFDRNTTYGIDAKNGSQLSIKNNQFERNLIHHIRISSNHFNIVGNSMYWKNAEDDMSGKVLPIEAIQLTSTENGLITGNSIQGKKMFSSIYGYYNNNTIYNNKINGDSDLPKWINIGTISVEGNSQATLRYQWDSLDFLNANGYDVTPVAIRTTNGSDVFYNNISFYIHKNNGLYATVTNNSDESKEFTVYVKLEHNQWTKR